MRSQWITEYLPEGAFLSSGTMVRKDLVEFGEQVACGWSIGENGGCLLWIRWEPVLTFLINLIIIS